MFRRVFLTLASAALALGIAAAPASAADDVAEMAQACAGCHGESGIPTDPKTIPIIWGQQQSYLMKQLRNYRNGERSSPIMSPIAKSLAEKDLRKIAAYFAAKPWPVRPKPPEDRRVGFRIRRIAKRLRSGMPSPAAQCQPCHQPNFEGGMPAPRLAGLSQDYLLAAMNAFADGKRTNNLDMPRFMQMLTKTQREDIARYLSAL